MLVQMYQNRAIYKCLDKGKYYTVDEQGVKLQPCYDTFGELVNAIKEGVFSGEPITEQSAQGEETITEVVEPVKKTRRTRKG